VGEDKTTVRSSGFLSALKCLKRCFVLRLPGNSSATRSRWAPFDARTTTSSNARASTSTWFRCRCYSTSIFRHSRQRPISKY